MHKYIVVSLQTSYRCSNENLLNECTKIFSNVTTIFIYAYTHVAITYKSTINSKIMINN